MLNTEIQRLIWDDLCPALVFVGINQFNQQSSRRLVFFPVSWLSVSGILCYRSLDSTMSSPHTQPEPAGSRHLLLPCFTQADSASCLSTLRDEKRLDSCQVGIRVFRFRGAFKGHSLICVQSFPSTLTVIHHLSSLSRHTSCKSCILLVKPLYSCIKNVSI